MLLKKIVVAEDDDAIAHMVTMALGDAGYLCIRARDGAEALQITRMHQPDLLVLDVMMPRIDGVEVCRAIKAREESVDTPVILLSAKDSDRDRDKGMEAGADLYLTKPFSPSRLIEEIRNLLTPQGA